MYRIKACFRSLQGEGALTGKAAVFCRLSGCNLWSGRVNDRDEAICKFCDTDFLGTDGPGGGTFPSAISLAQHIAHTWNHGITRHTKPFVIFTGGEPLLQLDTALIDACHSLDFEIAVETNGTLPCPPNIDWLCVSPKANTTLVQRHGNELKLVFPQDNIDPQSFESLDFQHFSLQPCDGPLRDENAQACIAYCLAHPRWRLSVQLHKLLGFP